MERYKDELDLYRAVAAMSGDVLFRYDISQDVMELFYGRMEMSKYGSTIHHYLQLLKKTNMLGMTEESAAEKFILALETGEPSSFECEIQLSNRIGSYRWYYVIGKTEYGDDNCPKYLIGKMRDIDEQKYQTNSITRDLQIDGLTSILTRDFLKKKLSEKCQECDGKAGAGAVISIDEFHNLTGEDQRLQNQLVAQVVQCIEACFHENVVLGRIQEDEFAVIYFGKDINSEFLPRLENLVECVSEVELEGHPEVKVTLSVGAYCGVYRRTKEHQLFEKVMSALNTAKYQGKEKIVVYSDEMDTRLKVQSRYLKSNDEVSNIKFDHKLVESSLEIMSDTGNIEEAIKHIFDEIGKRYNLDRIVVREMNAKERKMSISYNWINPKTPSIAGRIATEQLVVYDILEKTYQDDGVVIVEDIDKVDFDPDVADKVRALGMKSFVHCIFSGNAELCGCIGFESYTARRRWKTTEIKTFKLVTKLISSFLLNMRSYEEMLLMNKSYETHDALTGLAKFEVFVKEAESYVKTNPTVKCGILYTEIDNFTKINDLYGYDVGDRVLKIYAGILKSKENRFLVGCRMKADHFIVLILEFDTRGNKATATFVDRLNEEFQQGIKELCKEVELSLKGAVISVADSDTLLKQYMERAIEIVREG